MKRMKKLAALILTVLMAISMLTVPANAATRRSVKILSNSNSTYCYQLNRYGTRLTYGANYLKVGYMPTSSSCWMWYTAPTAGVYDFQFSNITSGTAHIFGNADFSTPSSYLYRYGSTRYPSTMKVTTFGGKSYSLYLCSLNVKAPAKDVYSNLHTRTGRVYLKKGQRVYLRAYFTTAKSKVTKFTVKVTKRS